MMITGEMEFGRLRKDRRYGRNRKFARLERCFARFRGKFARFKPQQCRFHLPNLDFKPLEPLVELGVFLRGSGAILRGFPDRAPQRRGKITTNTDE